MFRDLQYASRMLRKNPAFVVVAVVSLAIGIGATSAIYSLADSLLLRPLPVMKPSRVVALKPLTNSAFGMDNAISYPDYVDFRDRNRTFDGLVADSYSYFGFAPDKLTQPRMKFGMFVSGNFFKVLGVEPTVGRGFRPDEDRVQGRDAVAILSHDLWVSEYGAKPSAIGSKLRLNGVDFTIVGVAPESFTGTDQFLRPALYVPFAMSPVVGNGNALDQRQTRWCTVKGRLKPGVGLPQAQADIGALTAVLQKAYPQSDRNLQVKVETQSELQIEMSPPNTALLVMLFLLALCVLLVACANVAALLLSRSNSRTREFAVRLAIGAGRWSLIRQLLVENLMLAIAGGAAGLLVAFGILELFNSMPPPPSDLPLNYHMDLNGRALLFTAIASLLSTFLFGLAPALRTTRPDLVPSLKAIDPGASKNRRLWGRNLLVGGQVALSLVLLIVSGVLVEGFRAELTQGPGYRTNHLYLMSFDTGLLHYTDPQREQFYKQLIDKTRLAPNVASATLTSAIPMAIGGSMIGVVPEGVQLKSGQEPLQVFDTVASDGYFQTMNIPIVDGRGFLETDKSNNPLVAVVNEHFAHHYWPNQDAVGKTLRIRKVDGPLVRIVGVAKMSKYLWITESPMDFVYLPFSQNPAAQMTLVAQSKSNDTMSLATVLRGVVESIDRNMPVFDARSMQDLYQNRAVRTPNLLTEIVAGLGVMGLILAVVGLYGLVAYSVSQRTREIGIRMAIGADRPKVVTMVLSQGLKLGVGGVIVGLVIGILASRAMTSLMLFSFGHSTVLPFAVVPLLLIVTTVGATYLPARRASLIDPMRALRDE